MLKINSKIIILVMWLSAITVVSQNSTNSPYTRYGYGELANRSFGAGRAMGGIGIGLRSSKQINPMNPASYSSMDSLTFMFDFGASAQRSWYTDGTNSQSDFNGNVEYMAMQFPLHERIAVSIGMLPYSHVGYRFSQVSYTNGMAYSELFEGQGGLNQLYGGLSINLLKGSLSTVAIGANLNYMFGSIAHNATSAFDADNSTYVISTEQFRIRSVIPDFGLQGSIRTNKTDVFVAGFTYTPKTRLGSHTYRTITTSTVTSDTIDNLGYDTPVSYGIGVSYTRDNKFIAAADFTYQNWKEAAFAGENGLFGDRIKIAVGGEFIPNLFSRPYINKMRYRAGVNYARSYIKVNDKGYDEYAATFGVGLPITDGRSYLNVSFEYVNIKPELKNMVDEKYFRMTISYTFNELWFVKRKVD